MGFLNTHSVVKYQKIEGGNFYFPKKISMPKKTEAGDLLGYFNIHSVAKQQKIEGGTLWGKTFLVQFARPNGTIFGQFVWIEKKIRYNSHVSLHEAPTKNIGYFESKAFSLHHFDLPVRNQTKSSCNNFSSSFVFVSGIACADRNVYLYNPFVMSKPAGVSHSFSGCNKFTSNC